MMSAAHREKHRIYMREYFRSDPVRKEKNRLKVAEWRKNNVEKHRAYTARWKKENPDKRKLSSARERIKYADKRYAANVRLREKYPARFRAYVRARQAAQLRRTPAWANHDAILVVYELAERLTKETGVKHDVDHVIPLRGERVSGLHVHSNLQAIPASVNRRKNRKFELI